MRELGIMLEPWTDREDIKPGTVIVIEGRFSDEELTIDIGDENFVSIWSPPGSTFNNS
jgi:ribosomal protein L14E/L6E/L27E